MIHKATWMFSSIWGTIKPLLELAVTSEVVFAKNEKQLKEAMDAEQLTKG